MFVKDNDVVEIKIRFKKAVYRYDAYTEKELKEMDLKQEEKDKYKSLLVTMKLLTWGLYNDLQESAMVVNNDTGDRHFNLKTYKENRLKKLLVKWDAVNDSGSPVAINEGSIAHLAPDVAESILRAYDEASFLTEEQEKN